ncbi:TetR/AcrR family transcriptional regulator [Streptomyces beijiangensis]|uniref:TetR/AcrR family transcriptional regulator n=1 Tax=Streptomyces beijiangensis TaxID=163361 RepID=A0A939F9Q2_9ACTN|nr:TetR/AcrR family transcriptional regulator [Streptomyces beijiangensis]MBO0514642.1 TetR/AcrR family transcriptional regulator [Streptomyces beijiangensis]
MAGRLTPEREAELYEAVLGLLREVGYDGLTMDAVATRTRSSKATLYRQWGSKPVLVARALRHNKPVKLDQIDTGSLRGDFRTAMALGDDCKMEEDAALMRGLMHAIHDDPDLHKAVRELLFEPELNGLDRIMQRAVDRGEVSADLPALKYVTHMLAGAFVGRQFIEDKAPDQAFLTDYVDAVVFPALGV